MPAWSWITSLSDTVEGGTPGAFHFTRTGNISQPITVTYSIGGSATPDVDYTALSGSVSFAAQQDAVDVPVDPIDDSVPEFDESVEVALTAGTGYTVGDSDTAVVIIRDNDTPVISVQATRDAAEGGTPGQFTFVRTGDKSGTLTVNYSLGGTATNGTDFTALSGTVVFAAGDVNATVDVAATHDTVYDPDETVELTTTSGTGYTIDAQNNAATVRVFDDATHTFTVENNQGVIWYDIPWEDVDPDAASQSVTLSNFSLQLAGQTFSAADAQSAPTMQFENGVATGITFGIDTSGVANYSYTSLSMSGWNITAVPLVGDPFLVAAPPKVAALNVNLSTYNSSGFNHTLTVQYKLADNTTESIDIPIAGGTAATDVRNLVYSVLKDAKLDVTPLEGSRLLVKGTTNSQISEIRFTVNNPPVLWKGPSSGGKIPTGQITPKLFVNGTELP